MKSLSLIVLVLSAFGALALSGCSSCMPQMQTAKTPPKQTIITCGPGTIVSGNTCLGKK